MIFVIKASAGRASSPISCAEVCIQADHLTMHFDMDRETTKALTAQLLDICTTYANPALSEQANKLISELKNS